MTPARIAELRMAVAKASTAYMSWWSYALIEALDALSAATALLEQRDREIDELRCEVRRLEDAP